MKKTLLAVALTTLSLSAFAGDKYTFVASDESVETKVCMVAAAKGMKEARTYAKEQGVNFRTFKKTMTCNGKSLNQFVKVFNAEKEEEKTIKRKVLVAADGSKESQICVKAANQGVEAVKSEYKGDVSNISCNGKSLATFITKYKNM